MRVPPFERYHRWLRAAGLLIIGAVFGGSVILSANHQNLNQALIENSSMKLEITDLSTQLQLQTKHKHKSMVIQGIKVFVEDVPDKEPLDAITQNEIKERVKKNLIVLQGKSIATLSSPDIYRSLINRLHPQVNKKDYAVRLSMLLLLQSELKVWVTAQEFIRN